MTVKPKPLPAVQPNAGLEIAFQRKLLALLQEMHRSYVFWIKAAYREQSAKMATDASPAMALREVMRKLGSRWTKKINEAAPDLASYFSKSVADRSDRALATILRKAGIAISWKMTRAMNNVVQASIGEQVALITNIAEQYIAGIEGAVMRSVAAGRDLATLTTSLEKSYGIAHRRAVLIARDQNNKATATMTKTRQIEVGAIAVWQHSHGGKEPRPEHVKWGKEKREYDPATGMYSEVDKEYVWPGTPINCRCRAKTLFPWMAESRRAA